jgi:hypothetical protein
VKKTLKKLGAAIILLGSVNSFALPIDWSGNIGFDQNIIRDGRGIEGDCDSNIAGSECISNDNQHVRYQSLLLKLKPSIIVNDSVTVKGEVTTGTFRGAFLGENGTADSSYYAQTNSGSSLNFTQLYAEMYADTALFRVGKYARNYGLGAVINNGSKAWDRFFSSYEGVEAEFKLGNFKLIPALSKFDSSVTSPTGSVSPTNGKRDASEQSVVAMYDDSNKNLKIGIFYGVRDVESNSDLYTTKVSSQETTLIDIFFEKSWGDFKLGVEIPLISGEAGTAFTDRTNDQDFDARAYIVETTYQLNPRWKVGLNFGSVTGSDSDDDSHEAMYLHPNYQVAELMFRYNREGFQSNDQNALRSSIVNTNYAKLFAHYENDAWGWRLDFIMANALETASNGDDFYDHSSQTYQQAGADQKDDLGMEFDAAFDYKWSPAVIVTGYAAYYQVGEFYEFTNGNEEVDAASVIATGLKVNIGF